MEGIVETVTMLEGSILSATFDTSSLSRSAFVASAVFFGDLERQTTAKAISQGLFT